MKRSEVECKYTWNLADIFPNEEEWEKAYSYVLYEVSQLTKFKGKLSDKEVLLKVLKKNDEVSIVFEKTYCYAKMHKDENSADAKYVALTDRVNTLASEISTKLSFLVPELTAQTEDYLKSLIVDPDFSDYDYMIKEILRNKQHILPEGEEKLLAQCSNTLGMFQEIFENIDYVDLALPKITVDGEKIQLTQGRYSFLMQSQNQKTRKKAFDGLYSAYFSLIHTIACVYSGSVKKDVFLAKATKYKSCLEQSLSGDDVPQIVYDTLIKNVTEGLPLLHDYVGLRKKMLKLDKMHMYDMYVPLTKDIDMSLDYEQAFKLVLDGLKPMGDEYHDLLLRAKNERWIDVYETENKRNGAYSWGSFGTHPYVLLNYSSTCHDIFTIAHELGHSMHSYYSDSTQPYAKAQYSIFVAEVASTVNEVLLLKYMIKNAKSKEEKIFLLSYYLDMFRTTLFRQTMFAEFEKFSHKMTEKGEPLTVESMSNAYLKLNKKYYGKEVVHDKMIRYEWARIPHFYTSFYVYKYATGITSAVSIANSLLNDENFFPKYKEFLSSGGKMSPYEILKLTGVDLATDEPYYVVMNEFKQTLSQLKALSID